MYSDWNKRSFVFCFFSFTSSVTKDKCLFYTLKLPKKKKRRRRTNHLSYTITRKTEYYDLIIAYFFQWVSKRERERGKNSFFNSSLIDSSELMNINQIRSKERNGPEHVPHSSYDHLPASYRYSQAINRHSLNPVPSDDSGNESSLNYHQKIHSHFVVVAIDFGTTFSGYAFAFTRDIDSILMMRKVDGNDPGWYLISLLEKKITQSMIKSNFY